MVWRLVRRQHWGQRRARSVVAMRVPVTVPRRVTVPQHRDLRHGVAWGWAERLRRVVTWSWAVGLREALNRRGGLHWGGVHLPDALSSPAGTSRGGRLSSGLENPLELLLEVDCSLCATLDMMRKDECWAASHPIFILFVDVTVQLQNLELLDGREHLQRGRRDILIDAVVVSAPGQHSVVELRARLQRN